MRLTIPKLRTWHLLGIVAACAALFSIMQFRWSVEDPVYDQIRRLRSLDAEARAAAAGQLAGMRPRDRRAIPPLMELLYDPDPRPRGAAARSLSYLVRDFTDDAETGPIKAALTSALRDPDPGARQAIAVSLSRFRPEPKVVVPALIESVGVGDTMARGEVVEALGLFAVPDEAARSAVFAALGDPDSMVRWRAVHALSSCAIWPYPNRAPSPNPQMAPQPLLGMIIEALVKSADDGSPDVRSAVAYALGQIGNRSKAEIPRQADLLNDPNADVRNQAIVFLYCGRAGNRPPGLLPALVRALADKDERVRREAARKLGQFGLDAEPALPSLRPLADGPESDARREAVAAIEAIEKASRAERASFEKKVAELGDADPDVRALAADWLAGAGPKASIAVPGLARCLADADPDVRRAAAEALGKVGPAAAATMPDLAKLADSDPDEKVREVARRSRALLTRGDASPSP